MEYLIAVFLCAALFRYRKYSIYLQGNVLCKACLIQSRKETSLQATDGSTYPPTGWVMGPVFALELEVPGISLHLEQWQAIWTRKRAWVTGGKQNRDIKRLLLASWGRLRTLSIASFLRGVCRVQHKPRTTGTSPPLHNACVCQPADLENTWVQTCVWTLYYFSRISHILSRPSVVFKKACWPMPLRRLH